MRNAMVEKAWDHARFGRADGTAERACYFVIFESDSGKILVCDEILANHT